MHMIKVMDGLVGCAAVNWGQVLRCYLHYHNKCTLLSYWGEMPIFSNAYGSQWNGKKRKKYTFDNYSSHVVYSIITIHFQRRRLNEFQPMTSQTPPVNCYMLSKLSPAKTVASH